MTSRSRALHANPLLAWTDLAWKIGEMSMASAQVIAHRSARMAAAGPAPGARDRREFGLMGREKGDAAYESAQAVALGLMRLNLDLGARAYRHLVTGTAACLSLAASRNVGEAIARQAKLVETLSRTTLMAPSEAAHATVRLARRGLEPIHARATANAKRLGRR